MTIAITNLSRSIIDIVLPREIAPVIARPQRTTHHADGTIERTESRIVHGDSISFLAGETKTGLPNAYRRAPEIMKRVKSGALSIADEDEKAVEVATSEGVPTTSHRPQQNKGSKHSG
jgi:hypothetical protein